MRDKFFQVSELKSSKINTDAELCDRLLQMILQEKQDNLLEAIQVVKKLSEIAKENALIEVQSNESKISFLQKEIENLNMQNRYLIDSTEYMNIG